MGYRRSCGAQVQGKRSASFVMTVACAADVRFVVVDPNLGVTYLGSMPFGEKKRPHGIGAARFARRRAVRATRSCTRPTSGCESGCLRAWR